MKVIYLTWGETPRASGVYGSQVISQLKNINDSSSNIQITLVAGLPIIHSGLIREKLKYSSEIKKIKQNLSPLNFNLIRILAPQNFINKPNIGFYLFHMLANKKLIKFINSYNPDIIHCRSYHAVYAAIKAKQNGQFSYKIIFDARGLWPEQFAVSLKKNCNDSSYKKLKKLEKFIIKNSDHIVSVSKTMTNHFERIGVPSALLSTIYPSSPNWRKKTTLSSSQPNSYTFCYLGALNEATWHKPSILAKLFNYLLTLSSDAKLVIITKDSHEEIASFFSQSQLEKITFRTSNSSVELEKYLEDVDFGILSYFIPETELEVLFADTVMAIKTGEYLASALPVLVNKFCGGAATYVEENSVGVSYDPRTFQELTSESLEHVISHKQIKQAVKCSEKDFSYANNASKYLHIYHDLKPNE